MSEQAERAKRNKERRLHLARLAERLAKTAPSPELRKAYMHVAKTLRGWDDAGKSDTSKPRPRQD